VTRVTTADVVRDLLQLALWIVLISATVAGVAAGGLPALLAAVGAASATGLLYGLAAETPGGRL
jgi:hypothetical protein